MKSEYEQTMTILTYFIGHKWSTQENSCSTHGTQEGELQEKSYFYVNYIKGEEGFLQSQIFHFNAMLFFAQ